MKKAYRHIATYKLIYLGLTIQLLFYVSAAWTGWFNIFFNAAALHLPDPTWGNVFQGIDFYQVPRGAWALWHGGSLTGDPLGDGTVYAQGQTVNVNVYHPLFTILIGSFLLLFSPSQAFYVWLWIKLAISLLAVAYFYRSFRDHKYVQFAVFILLVSFSEYVELAAGQFHLILNVLLLLFFISLVKKRPDAWNDPFYYLSMLVKPIGFLFVPILIIKRRWKIAVLGVSMFALSTWLLNSIGGYYLDNLIANILHPDNPGPTQIITLNALLHYSTHWPDMAYTLIRYGVLAIVVLLSSFRRIHISSAIFLMVVYFLMFYNLVYEYDWSTLSYIIAVCIVCNPSFQTKLSRVCILLTCLPSCFVILRLLHFDITDRGGIYGAISGNQAWQWMVISKVIPILLLCGSVLATDIKPIAKQIKTRFITIRKTNNLSAVFGKTQEK